MCLIIDVNIASLVLLQHDDPDFCDVHKFIFTGNGANVVLYYCEHMICENHNTAIRKIILELDRAGRAKQYDANAVSEEIVNLQKSRLCCSNDQHIIALARVSGARLLCSRDNNLSSDFTNPQILNNPRGKVYKKRTHKHLLRKLCS